MPNLEEMNLLRTRIEQLENGFANLKKDFERRLKNLKAGGVDQSLIDSCIK